MVRRATRFIVTRRPLREDVLTHGRHGWLKALVTLVLLTCYMPLEILPRAKIQCLNDVFLPWPPGAQTSWPLCHGHFGDVHPAHTKGHTSSFSQGPRSVLTRCLCVLGLVLPGRVWRTRSTTLTMKSSLSLMCGTFRASLLLHCTCWLWETGCSGVPPVSGLILEQLCPGRVGSDT